MRDPKWPSLAATAKALRLSDIFAGGAVTKVHITRVWDLLDEVGADDSTVTEFRDAVDTRDYILVSYRLAELI